MAFLNGANNLVLVDNCQNLFNLQVQLQVTEDLVTLGDTGFSLQLNCYPPIGAITPNATPQTGSGQLSWFQYLLNVWNNSVTFEIQYWAFGTHSYQAAGPGGNPPAVWWPPTYTPNPLNTSPWLPVFPNVAAAGTVVGSTSSSRVPAGSVITIQLATDSSGNVTGATFSITNPSGSTSTQPWQQYAGQSEPPGFGAFPIYGFQVNLVSLPSSACTFTSGAGTITYSVSSGTLSVQSVNTCGGSQPGTGENSNVIYQDVSPASGSSISQPFAVPAMGMAFNFDKSTFGQDEVKQSPSWGSAYWLAISGFPNSALGFNSQSALNGPPTPAPQITAAINSSLNTGLTANQIATIASNLPVVNTFGPPPVQAIDSTLGLNYQTFFCPFTISFPNLNAFNALNQHQAAIVTLTAKLTVQVPTGVDAKGNVTTAGVPLSAQANIELAKGEDPYFFDLNPSDPQDYPSWLSFDLRLFKVTPTQPHLMFSVPNPTTGDPTSANGPITYIQTVLKHLNKPSLITNGDTFDNALTQDEEGSAIVFFPNDDAFVPSFNFAVGRVRVTSSITTTIGPVRVFFRLFNAASTNSNFAEVGTNEGTYRWGTDGTPEHKIPLLGVQGPLVFGAEYVTVPCFATERVNLNQPADMKTQTDPPNVQTITTAAGSEIDTYFGCWLDVNQSTPFLISIPPLSPLQWDGPWTGTESLNGVISTAPHQCLIAEIRFDDTPIPNGATSATSDKLAQRNIAWLGTQP
jgi:hypothetical protein